MQKNTFSKKSVMTFALSLLVFAPGCWKSDNKNGQQGIHSVNDGSTVMLSIDGTPYITEKSFQNSFDQLVNANASNQQFQMMLKFLPNAKEEIFKGQANEKIILYWAEKEGVTQKKEYQEKLEQGIKMLQVGLAAEFFQKDFAGELKPTEEELRAFYEQNKAQILLAPASYKALGVKCSSADQAATLYAQVKQSPKNFKAIAGAAHVKELNVTEYSFDVDAAIKEAVSAVAKFPSVISVTDTEGKPWVVVVTSHEEAQYQPFEKVRQGLEQAVAQQKIAKFYIERINQLREQYHVVENTANLTVASPSEEDAAEDALAQVLGEQMDAGQDGLDLDNIDLPAKGA